MKINVLRKMEYGNCTIYLMQFFDVFQYLFSDRKGEIFQDHVTLKPNIFKSILFRLGFIKSQYSEEELEFGEELVLSAAIKSVDALAGKKEEPVALPKKAKESGDCMWRAVVADDGGMAYQCVLHPDNIVRMEGDEKPFHN